MPRICVYGAGSIGCYVGGRLAAADADVVLVGRQRVRDDVAGGLHLTDYRGADVRATPEFVLDTDGAAAAEGADLVLVTVKSAATPEVAEILGRALRPDAVVVSLQNGLRNADLLRAALPGRTVLTGMVPFNVVNLGGGAFHQGSEGGLEVQDDPAVTPYEAVFARAGLPLTRRADMDAVLRAKLLLNLNNAVNALSGLPLKAELSQRTYRRCLALAQREAYATFRAAGWAVARITPLPPGWIPRLLVMPDRLYATVAGPTLAIDPLARSSMWEDLEAGRVTEIEWINGEVVRLAETLGRTAPVNARLVALVRAAEAGGPRAWSGDDLLADLRAAAAQP
ncbi:2-dehydropantoate 2-reductase [Mumia sp. DW29H23]|uniref:2-dehydropantoate 2-reductase n=1 Tax=Mumia sp. DW29H23 TaxID=3421241 RepID=UPI003D681C5D